MSHYLMTTDIRNNMTVVWMKNCYTIINLKWRNKVLYSMFSVVFIQLLTKRGYMISIYLFLRTALEILRKVFQTTFYGWMILVIYDVL